MDEFLFYFGVYEVDENNVAYPLRSEEVAFKIDQEGFYLFFEFRLHLFYGSFQVGSQAGDIVVEVKKFNEHF